MKRLIHRVLGEVVVSHNGWRMKQNLNLMLLYPLIYAICCVPLSIYRMLRFLSLLRDGDVDSRVTPTGFLYGFGQVLFILLGFFDALVLGCSNSTVRKQWCSERVRSHTGAAKRSILASPEGLVSSTEGARGDLADPLITESDLASESTENFIMRTMNG